MSLVDNLVLSPSEKPAGHHGYEHESVTDAFIYDREYGTPELTGSGARSVRDLYAQLNRKWESAVSREYGLYAEAIATSILGALSRRVDTARWQISRDLVRTRRKLMEVMQREGITMIDCFLYNPRPNIRLLSMGGVIGSVFSLAVSVATGIHILNPFVALLTIVASTGFFLMTLVPTD